jgi:hypothetical protein
MEKCRAITQELIRHPFTEPFLRPVDPVADHIPDYFRKIKQPMDFQTVISKLDSRSYATWKDWAADVHLIFANCVTYNGPKSYFGSVAKCLRKRFDRFILPMKLHDYDGWADHAAALHARLSKALRASPPEMRKLLPPGSLSLPDTVSNGDYEQLAVKLSLLKNPGQMRQILQILTMFGFEVPPATKTKKSEFNIKLLPLQAVRALQKYVNEGELT